MYLLMVRGIWSFELYFCNVFKRDVFGYRCQYCIQYIEVSLSVIKRKQEKRRSLAVMISISIDCDHLMLVYFSFILSSGLVLVQALVV